MNGKLKYYLLILSFLLFGSLAIFRPPGVWFDIVFCCFVFNTLFVYILFARFVVLENIKIFRKLFGKNKTDDEAESGSTE